MVQRSSASSSSAIDRKASSSRSSSSKTQVLNTQSKSIIKLPPLAKLQAAKPTRRTGQQGLGKIRIQSTINAFGTPVVSYTFESPSGRSVTGNAPARRKRRGETYFARSQKEFDAVLENMAQKDRTLVDDAAEMFAKMSIQPDSKLEEEELLLSGLEKMDIGVEEDVPMKDTTEEETYSRPVRYIDEDYDAPAPAYSAPPTPPPAYHKELEANVVPSPTLGISRTSQENGYQEYLQIEAEANMRLAIHGYKVVIAPGDRTEIEDHPVAVYIASLWDRLVQLCDAFYLYPQVSFEQLETLPLEHQESWGYDRETPSTWSEPALLTPPPSPTPAPRRVSRTYDTVNSRRTRTGNRSTRGAERY